MHPPGAQMARALATPPRRAHHVCVRKLSFALVLCATLVALPGHAAMQSGADATLARYEGRFVNPAADDGRAAIERAIAAGIADMNVMRRFIAERRLLENNPPIPAVNVRVAGDGLIVDYSGGRRHVTPSLDTWVRTRAPDGGSLEVRHRFSNGRLIQAFREPNGGAEHVFKLSSDGTRLTLKATISSPHIPHPIAYQLVLTRAR
jgi:hypothetical protein